MSKVLKFPTDENAFPPNVFVRSILFLGAAISMDDGQLVSPRALRQFEKPITGTQAREFMGLIKNQGGVMGDNQIFIPWPCAAIYFEFTTADGDPLIFEKALKDRRILVCLLSQ